MTPGKVGAVVVGSGAGGGIVAKELAEAGLSVVLLERGGWVENVEHHDDEFLGWTAELLSPDRRHVRVARKQDQWVTVRPGEAGYNGNADAVGGGTQFYGGMAWRNSPKDFRMRSTYGTVAGSSLDDWPITYDDLDPYYEKVEWEIGVAGDMSGCPHAPPRKRGYPMPPFPLNQAAAVIAEAGKGLGLYPIPVPYLRNSVPYDGRPACILRRLCAGFSCPIHARNGTHNTVIPKAIATGLFELRPGCMAAEVKLDARGRATGIRYFDSLDRERFQPAELVVLAAGAMETARLLLNSKSRLFPNGAGNNQGWVGHNLHSHLYHRVAGIWDEAIHGEPGPEACLGFIDFAHGNPGLIGGGLIDAPRGFHRAIPYVNSLQGWGPEFKARAREFPRWAGVTTCVQEMPVFDSRVLIDPRIKDHWGIPALRIEGKRHPNDFAIQNFLVHQAAAILRAAGAKRVNVMETPVPKAPVFNASAGGQHQAGTCRMGNDPKTSVTNRYGQLHEIDNIYCADASLIVNNGCLNPVETIMALAYWVSDHIRKQRTRPA